MGGKWRTFAEYLASMNESEREEYERTKRKRDDFFRPIVEANLRDQEVVMKKLAAEGFPAPELKDLISKYAPFQPKLTNLLIEIFQESQNKHIREGIVRSLCGAGPEYDPRALIQAFDKSDRQFSFAIVNTLIVTRVKGAESWLKELSQEPDWGKLIKKLRRDSPHPFGQ